MGIKESPPIKNPILRFFQSHSTLRIVVFSHLQGLSSSFLCLCLSPFAQGGNTEPYPPDRGKYDRITGSPRRGSKSTVYFFDPE